MSRRSHRREACTAEVLGRAVGLVVLGFVTSAGCGAVAGRNRSPAQELVEAPAPAPAMTPAEVGRRFRAAYSEGIRLAGRQQYGLALGAFEQALALRPSSVEAMFNLGACHEEMGDPLRAINVYRRVLRAAPSDPDCYANLGTSYIKLYHREKSPVWRKMARKAWQRSLELDPRQPDIRRYLAATETPD